MYTSYEQDLMEQWNKWKQENQYSSMHAMLETELSMPYISPDFEMWLLNCKDELHDMEEKSGLVHSRAVIDDENASKYLFGSYQMQLIAVQYLSQRNLRNYLNLIRQYVSSEQANRYCVGFLISACVEQRMMEELQVRTREGLFITCIPHYLENPLEADGMMEASQFFKKWFSNNEPQLEQMCMEVLIQEAYLQMPITIEEEDGYLVALAIARYVFYAWNREEDWEELYEKECNKSLKLPQLETEMIEKV